MMSMMMINASGGGIDALYAGKRFNASLCLNILAYDYWNS